MFGSRFVLGRFARTHSGLFTSGNTLKTRSTALPVYLSSKPVQPARVAVPYSIGQLSTLNKRCDKILPQLLYAPSKHFHRTPQRNVNPLIWVFVKPAAKLVTILSGRSFRKWWASLEVIEKKQYKKKYGYYALAALSMLGLLGAVNYFTHLQETPITKRKRYVAFTPDQFMKIVNYEYETHMDNFKGKIVAFDHPVYKLVARVTQRIVDGNQDLDFMKGQTWKIIVVNSKEANAFVLPTGHIFVNTGLMEITENEDQLAVVIGHEMAHAILGHGAEQVSVAQLLDMVVIVVMAGIWAFMGSDGIAVVTQWFFNKCTQLLLHLPYSRKLEAEADQVGLSLMAKACFDVRESSLFWNFMRLKETVDNGGEVALPDWLSTHPSHASRASELDEMIPKAIDMRKHCNCPKLPSKDPRENLKFLQDIVNKEMIRREEEEAERRKKEKEEEEERQEKVPEGYLVGPKIPQPNIPVAVAKTGG